MSDVFGAIREASRAVSEQAQRVTIDDDRLAAFCAELVADPPAEDLDPSRQALGSPEETLAFVVTLDAINFGSGWFPVLEKPEGKSGYRTIAGALERHFLEHGAFSAAALQRLDLAACARLFGQSPDGEPGELMGHFAQALQDLGVWLAARFDGSFAAMVEAAEGRASNLVPLLAEMPLYRDVSRYRGRDVPFYKRAQITAWDLHCAFGGEGPGRFVDLDRLTLFADNLVPHVLRRAGVLRYDAALADAIDGGTRLESGSEEEIEIRACGVEAVERCVAAARAAGHDVNAALLDGWLWNRGQDPTIKAHPRHRARSVFY